MTDLYFTPGDDSYSARTDAAFSLYFAGGKDILRMWRGVVTADMGDDNDTVIVRGGLLTAMGGAGNDRFVVMGSNATLHGNDDADRFDLRSGDWLTASGDNGADRFNVLAASHDLSLTGGADNDMFVNYGFAVTGFVGGDAGNDRFYGFFGPAVTLAGGEGDDLYRIDPVDAPTVVENAGEGNDAVQVAMGSIFAMPDNIERLSVQAFGGLFGNGYFTGNTLDNQMSGSAGAETLNGGGGNDTLSGSGGEDSLFGNDGNDTLIGGTGRDTLDGGTGDDQMAGGADDDSYYVDTVGDTVTELANEGNDTVNFAITGQTLGANIESGILLVAGNLTGNDLNNYLEGSAGNDTLDGGTGGSDSLNGGDGDDYINGGQGTAYILGGDGDDTILGSAGDDELYGDSGDDSIFSGGGTDVIDGGAGNDLLVVDAVGGLAALHGGAGMDVFGFRSSTAGVIVGEIDDFLKSEDFIDLSGYDADALTPGMQHLVWADGTNDGHIGVVSLEQVSRAMPITYHVTADVDGDGHADLDFYIDLVPSSGFLDQTDFLL